MIELFEQVKDFMFLLVLATPRLGASFIAMSFVSRQMLTSGMARNSVIMALAMFMVPVVDGQMPTHIPVGPGFYLLILKEFMLGFMVGYCAAIPFWVMEGVGTLIDNQRGASFVELLNIVTSSTASTLGILFSQGTVALFFSTGLILVFLEGLYASYSMWPIGEFFPTFELASGLFFLEQLDFLFGMIILIAAPVVFAMFMTEFGLALVSRFAPQLNVFFLAFPVKSGVAVGILIVYFATIISFASDLLDDTGRTVAEVFGILS